MNYRIGQLASITGCPTVTIRYYEKAGLLKKPPRGGSNYREYDDAALERLAFILHCRRHGISLADIRQLLVLRDNSRQECGFAHELVARQLKQVEEQIASLQKLKAVLKELACADACAENESCAILRHLDEPGACPFCKQPAKLSR